MGSTIKKLLAPLPFRHTFYMKEIFLIPRLLSPAKPTQYDKNGFIVHLTTENDLRTKMRSLEMAMDVMPITLNFEQQKRC